MRFDSSDCPAALPQLCDITRAGEEKDKREPAEDLGHWYQARWPRLLYHALALVGDRAAAEDLAQETFLRLLSEVKHGGSIRSLLSWTNTVLRNLVLNYIEHSRVAGKVVQADIESWEETAARPAPSVEDSLIAAERRAVLRVAIAELSAVERECVLLFGDGCSFQDIAAQKRMSYGVAVSTVRRGLRKIRRRLSSAGC